MQAVAARGQPLANGFGLTRLPDFVFVLAIVDLRLQAFDVGLQFENLPRRLFVQRQDAGDLDLERSGFVGTTGPAASRTSIILSPIGMANLHSSIFPRAATGLRALWPFREMTVLATDSVVDEPGLLATSGDGLHVRVGTRNNTGFGYRRKPKVT